MRASPVKHHQRQRDRHERRAQEQDGRAAPAPHEQQADTPFTVEVGAATPRWPGTTRLAQQLEGEQEQPGRAARCAGQRPDHHPAEDTELPAGDGRPSSRVPTRASRPPEAERERAVGVDPDPHERDRPARIGRPSSTSTRPGRGARRGAGAPPTRRRRSRRRGRRAAHGQQAGRAGEVPHQGRQPGHHQRVQHPDAVETARGARPAVQERREPALDDPRLTGAVNEYGSVLGTARCRG